MLLPTIRIIALATACAACGPGASQLLPTGKPPGAITGERCRDERPEGPATAVMKRFELRTGRGVDPLSVTIDGVRWEKDLSDDHAGCGYVELSPGSHTVELRVKAADAAHGIHPELAVGEWGPEARSWYDTFAVSCGAAAQCSKNDIQAWLDGARKVKRGLFDPCGSTRVSHIAWRTEQSPDVLLEDLVVSFSLDIYRFSPRFRHGAPKCSGVSDGAAAPVTDGEP